MDFLRRKLCSLIRWGRNYSWELIIVDPWHSQDMHPEIMNSQIQKITSSKIMGGLLSLSHKYWPYSESSLQNVTQVNNFPTLSKIYLLPTS